MLVDWLVRLMKLCLFFWLELIFLTCPPPHPQRIMGLYVSVVLVIGKFVRGFFSEISHSIMFEELPCVDRILKLCTDIFLVSADQQIQLKPQV